MKEKGRVCGASCTQVGTRLMILRIAEITECVTQPPVVAVELDPRQERKMWLS